MLGNWVKQTTTTTGTGALTLATVSGFPTFNERFGQNTHFEYTILDSATGSPIECGIGHLSDATTLVRDFPLETYVGGVLLTSAPSAANLAAGTYRVECTAEAGMLAPTYPSPYAPAGQANSKRFISLPSYDPSKWDIFTPTYNAINYFPVFINTVRPINAVYIDATTAASGLKLKFGLYSVNPATGGPGKLLFDTGDIACDAAAFVGASITARRIPPGWYWAALQEISPNLQMTAAAACGENPLGWAGGLAKWKVLYTKVTSVYAAFTADAVTPNSPTYQSTFTVTTPIPVVWFQTI